MRKEPKKMTTSVPASSRRNIDYQGDRQLDTALEYLERYLPTLEPNDIRIIQQILATATFERRQFTGPLRRPAGRKA